MKNYVEAFKEEADYRSNIDFQSLCTYGVKALDDAFVAIAPDELVVIGACSGYGKSELALAISRHNALKGKKVAHYHLEGGYKEAMQRIKWRDICDTYYARHKGAMLQLNFRNWSLNKDVNPLLSRIEAEVYAELSDKLKDKLFFYDKPEGLTCDAFLESLLDFHDLETAFANPHDARKKKGFDLDLVVIDHLQYFSLDKDEDELQEITRILKEAKRINETMQIPVILVSHLRKLPRGHGVPDKEDIYGTSNIHKVANTCIIIHPDHEKDRSQEGIYPTFIRVAKSRIGLRPNELIYCNFDAKNRKYEKTYEIVRCFPNGEVAPEPMPAGERPMWYDGDRREF